MWVVGVFWHFSHRRFFVLQLASFWNFGRHLFHLFSLVLRLWFSKIIKIEGRMIQHGLNNDPTFKYVTMKPKVLWDYRIDEIQNSCDLFKLHGNP